MVTTVGQVEQSDILLPEGGRGKRKARTAFGLSTVSLSQVSQGLVAHLAEAAHEKRLATGTQDSSR